MTETEARARAEQYVYWEITDCILMCECEKFGVPICDKKGEYRSISEMEEDLIEAMVNAWRIATGLNKEREDKNE